MFRLVPLLLAVTLLSGCANLGLGGPLNSASFLCKHHDSAEAAAVAALAKAKEIVDPVKREAALGAVRTTLAMLDQCPPPAVTNP